MKKILITGGFGFIGKNLIEYLNESYELVILDKFIDENFIKNCSNIKFYQYDFFKDNSIKEILKKEEPNYIINLISIVTAERKMNIFQEMIEVNLNILLNLYEASKGLKSLEFFLQFGSGEEYGNIEPPFKESDREYPNSPYSLVKQLTTNTSIMLNKNYNFPIAVVRPGNLFGKYQSKNKFIPYIINQLLKNETIETTFGEQKRDFIYAFDFAKGIEMILQNYNNFVGEVVNLSSGKSISLKEIILFCKELVNSDSKVDFGKIPYRENEMMNFKLDMEKLRNGISDEFEVDILKGLKNYINVLRGE